MLKIFNKKKYVKYIQVLESKRVKVTYYKDNKLPKKIIINPDHVFLDSKGYRTIFIRENAPESMNPLDFNSVMDGVVFETAINNKLIRDTFATVDDNKMDFVKILLIGVAIGVAIILFGLWNSGVISL